MNHTFHQTKFRWTENLTSRFIQLRKENGNLFTGRKYSAQAGWEHILQQMRQEFPTIMADVHYRVLKKKWSNLLQQYKELKNPVHGDKNKSDDVSWPFYGAIDEVLGYSQRNQEEDDLNPHEFLCLSVTPDELGSPDEEAEPEQEEEEEQGERLVDSKSTDNTRSSTVSSAMKRLRNFNQDFSIEIERLPRNIPIRGRTRTSNRPSSQICQKLRLRDDASEVLVSRLPPATELSIKTIKSPSTISNSVGGLRIRKYSNNKDEKDDSPRQYLRDALGANNNISKNSNGNHIMNTVCNYENEVDIEEDEDEEVEEEEIIEELDEIGEEDEEVEEDDDDDDEEKERPRKLLRRNQETPQSQLRFNNNYKPHECNSVKLEKRLNEFLEYTKRRDEENRIIMTRILNAVEKIAEKK